MPKGDLFTFLVAVGPPVLERAATLAEDGSLMENPVRFVVAVSSALFTSLAIYLRAHQAGTAV